MKIVIATPLFPPDTGTLATYVKELAGRLAQTHAITVALYGRLPEQVERVRFVCADKRRPLPIRIVHFFFMLRRAVRDTDILFAENGSSTELPAALIALVSGTPLVLHMGDPAAREYAQKRFTRRIVERFAMHCAREVIFENPMPKPEILPFEPKPAIELEAYERSWNAHMEKLERVFNHAKK